MKTDNWSTIVENVYPRLFRRSYHIVPNPERLQEGGCYSGDGFQFVTDSASIFKSIQMLRLSCFPWLIAVAIQLSTSMIAIPLRAQEGDVPVSATEQIPEGTTEEKEPATTKSNESPNDKNTVKDPLVPYTGPQLEGVDTTTLKGKVVTGYQGWFNCEGDGANLGWTHWARDANKPVGPNNVSVDLWPDLSDFPEDELYPTEFKFPNLRTAKLFSSYRRETVLRHFKWMREYGIDGAMVQRFANGLASPALRHHKDVVLANCREGANTEGRCYAVMYDLSGLKAGEVQVVIDDWKMLRAKMEIGKDRAYLKPDGKPLVAVWGIGFNDDRKYTLSECKALVEFLKQDGCAVMIGVPTGWREMDRDSVKDPMLHEIIAMADVVSPWSVGRFRNPTDIARVARPLWRADVKWCRERSINFMPVVYPGFSWRNLKGDAPIDEIPRLGGDFLWMQFLAAKACGAKMVYVAMFDEVDEGTAIFKCTDDPPRPKGKFLGIEGLPTDHYLFLVGEGKNHLVSESPFAAQQPKR